MNRLQLRTLARQRLDDQTLPYLWSDDELNGFIHQSIDEAVIRSRSLLDSTTTEICRIKVIADRAAYPLHPAIFQIKRVYSITGNYPLTQTSFEALDENNPVWQTVTGLPTHYIDDFNHYGDDDSNGRTITLYPIPNAAIELKLSVYRTQLCELADTDSPELPEFQHADLINWVCHLAYLKQDADAVNIGKSEDFERKFTVCFGQKQDARRLEWRRKARRLFTSGNFF